MAASNERREPGLGTPARSLGRNRAALPEEAGETVDEQGEIHGRVSPSAGLTPPPASSARDLQIKALLVDVFEQTGIKVTPDDPIVAAALIQSAFVRRAGDDAASHLQRCVIEAVATISEAVSTERAAAASLDRAAGAAYEQIIVDAKTVGQAELAQLRDRFTKAAIATLEEVRSRGELSAGGVRWRVAAGVLVGLLLGALLAIGVGQIQPRPMSAEQVRLMHNGLMLDAAWGSLPPAAKARIEGARPPPSTEKSSGSSK